MPASSPSTTSSGAGATRSPRRTLVGVVTSAKMSKTIAVKVIRKVKGITDVERREAPAPH